MRWAEACFDEAAIHSSSYTEFLKQFKQTFHSSVSEEEATKRLWSLKQENRSVAEFAIEFRTLAADSGWNQPALKGALHHSLNEKIKDKLACRDEPAGLDKLIELAICLDNRLGERNRQRPSATSSSRPIRELRAPTHLIRLRSPSPPPEHEPMQTGRARLTPDERQHRLATGRCLCCGSPHHFSTDCPICPKATARQ